MSGVLVNIVVNRSDFIFDCGVDGRSIELVLIILVIISPLERESPACALLVAFYPPAVKH